MHGPLLSVPSAVTCRGGVKRPRRVAITMAIATRRRRRPPNAPLDGLPERRPGPCADRQDNPVCSWVAVPRSRHSRVTAPSQEPRILVQRPQLIVDLPARRRGAAVGSPSPAPRHRGDTYGPRYVPASPPCRTGRASSAARSRHPPGGLARGARPSRSRSGRPPARGAVRHRQAAARQQDVEKAPHRGPRRLAIGNQPETTGRHQDRTVAAREIKFFHRLLVQRREQPARRRLRPAETSISGERSAPSISIPSARYSSGGRPVAQPTSSAGYP